MNRGTFKTKSHTLWITHCNSKCAIRKSGYTPVSIMNEPSANQQISKAPFLLFILSRRRYVRVYPSALWSVVLGSCANIKVAQLPRFCLAKASRAWWRELVSKCTFFGRRGRLPAARKRFLPVCWDIGQSFMPVIRLSISVAAIYVFRECITSMP